MTYIFKLILCTIGYVTFSLASQPDLKTIDADGHKIYTASLRLSTGTVYFACEPITADRENKWRTYKHRTTQFVYGGRGVFTFCASKGMDENSANLAFPETTVHKKEVMDLFSNLENRKKMYDALSGIGSGCAGMHTSSGTFISYISKEPVTGFFPFPERKKEMILKTI